MRPLGGVAVGLVFLAAGASPAWAADAVVQATDAPGWDVQVVDIQPGDSVTWRFEGTTQAHNVQSAAGDWTSGVGLVPPPVTHQYREIGTFRFICQVHPDTMFGDVRVADVPLPPPPPPPLSAQPFANDFGAPVPEETGVAVDTVRPRLTAVSVRGRRVRFKVSEEAVVTVTVKRGGRVVKSLSATGSGATLSGLRAGRYVVQLRATDVAGNRSALRRVGVVVPGSKAAR